MGWYVDGGGREGQDWRIQVKEGDRRSSPSPPPPPPLRHAPTTSQTNRPLFTSITRGVSIHILDYRRIPEGLPPSVLEDRDACART